MQPTPRRYRDGNSLRTIMRRKGDTLASMRISSCRQGGGILGALGSDSARVQGLKVIFYFFHILFHRTTYIYISRKEFEFKYKYYFNSGSRHPRSKSIRSTGWTRPVCYTSRPRRTSSS